MPAQGVRPDVQGLGAAETLRVWEQAERLSPVERALVLASAAPADTAVLVGQPIGRTNAVLLRLREATLGPAMAATAGCPGCGSRVEFSLDTAGLLGLAADIAAGDDVSVENIVGFHVTWRPPTPADLTAVARAPEPARDLLRRCVSARDAEQAEVDAATLPASVLGAVEAAMSEADPLAEVLVSMTCPHCGSAFDADVDVVSFVWAEVDARAKRLLQEVGVLARAYGWAESQVLALSESRRAAYLRLVLDGVP